MWWVTWWGRTGGWCDVARFCLSPGCPEVIDAKSGWCQSHDPWTARKWRSRLPAGSRPNGWAWGAIRRRVLARDNRRCVKCGAQAEEVDHIVPVARCVESGLNAHDLSNLQSLCAGCHRAKSEADRIEGMRLSRESKKGRRR